MDVIARFGFDPMFFANIGEGLRVFFASRRIYRKIRTMPKKFQEFSKKPSFAGDEGFFLRRQSGSGRLGREPSHWLAKRFAFASVRILHSNDADYRKIPPLSGRDFL